MRELIQRRYDPEWEDMSDYVVHFTRKTPENDSVQNMASMLLAGEIEARTKFGVGRYSVAESYTWVRTVRPSA